MLLKWNNIRYAFAPFHCLFLQEMHLHKLWIPFFNMFETDSDLARYAQSWET